MRPDRVTAGPGTGSVSCPPARVAARIATRASGARDRALVEAGAGPRGYAVLRQAHSCRVSPAGSRKRCRRRQRGASVPAGGTGTRDVLVRDRQEIVSEHPLAPPLRALRRLAHEEPGHAVQHRHRPCKAARAAWLPRRTGQLPDLVVSGVYLDPGVVRGHEAAEVDLLGERHGLRSSRLFGVVGERRLHAVEVVERQQAHAGFAEVADRIVPVRDRPEDVVAVVAGIVAVATELALVPGAALVVALGVLDQRACSAGGNIDPSTRFTDEPPAFGLWKKNSLRSGSGVVLLFSPCATRRMDEVFWAVTRSERKLKPGRPLER